MLAKGANSITIVTLLDKPSRREKPMDRADDPDLAEKMKACLLYTSIVPCKAAPS